MPNEITLIDRGRGLQLSTSRITVHDLVPYFQQGCAYDEIIRWLPSLTEGEISVVERYYLQHKDELDEYEQRVQKHRDEQVRLQRLRLGEPGGSRLERLAHQRELLKQRRGRRTVKGLVADANIQGQVEYLAHRMQAEPWADFWQALGLALHRFEDVGLQPAATDFEVWNVCQAEQLVLITDNRNLDSEDSLEATIRRNNTPRSLPVFTIADMNEFRTNASYAERVVEALYDYLLRIDEVRGAGRLYLP